MKHDEATGFLDELLDGELSKARSAEVRRHIEECDECRSEARSIRILTKALAANPPDKLRDDEREALVGAAIEAAETGDELKARRQMPPIAWIGIAAAIVLLVAVALPVLLTSNKPGGKSGSSNDAAVQSSEARGANSSQPQGAAPAATLPPNAPLPVVVSKGKSYRDTAAIDEAYRANPQASSFVGYYKASDVGALQAMMQTYVNEQAPKDAERSPAECMNTVFRSVPRPLLPAYVERAKYDGTDSWAIVFAFAPDSAPDSLLSENLIYVMTTADCGLVATASYR